MLVVVYLFYGNPRAKIDRPGGWARDGCKAITADLMGLTHKGHCRNHADKQSTVDNRQLLRVEGGPVTKAEVSSAKRFTLKSEVSGMSFR